MKASRAYIAGLGTSGVLIGCFLLLLAVVGTIVAFRGAPGEAGNRGLDRLDVSDSRQASQVTRAPGLGSDARRGAPARGDGASRHGARKSARAGRAGRAGVAAGGVAGERIVGGQAGGAAPAGDGGTGGGQGVLPRLPVDPRRPGGAHSAPRLGDVAGGLGGAVEETAGGLGTTVGTVAPPLEAPGVRTGETVSGVVEQAAPVLDGTANGVTGAVGGETDRVTGVTDGLGGGGN